MGKEKEDEGKLIIYPRGEIVRVFIAIELDKSIKQYIGRKQEIVRNYSLKGNFSRIDNFHLTLRFIGEVNNQDVEKLKNVINQLTLEYKPFNFTLGNLGFFPSRNKKIVWIGVKSGEKELKSLFNKLEGFLETNGFPRESRGFKPHITIGREIRLKVDIEEIRNNISIENIVVPVERISLMESTRVNGKLSYIPIHISNLKR